jgi:hypothetical protein
MSLVPLLMEHSVDSSSHTHCSDQSSQTRWAFRLLRIVPSKAAGYKDPSRRSFSVRAHCSMDDDLRVPSAAPTSAVPLLETEHGRLRREQQGIDKRDLQAVRKHGTRVAVCLRPRNGDPTVIDTYNGINYIVNE